MGVGIDWAAVTALLARIIGSERDPAEERVVIETNPRGAGGMVVGHRVHGGSREPGPDRAAACPCEEEGRRGGRPDPSVLVGGSGAAAVDPARCGGAELRALARDDERANRDQRRLLNRLRADLIATFPAAMRSSPVTLGRPTFLRMLERWPTAQALRQAPREQIVALAPGQAPRPAGPLRRPGSDYARQ